MREVLRFVTPAQQIAPSSVFAANCSVIGLPAAGRVVLGALLIAASFSCRFTEVVLGLGIFTVLVGGIPMALGLPKMQAFVDWWMGKSDGVLRAMTVIALLFGAALIYAA